MSRYASTGRSSAAVPISSVVPNRFFIARTKLIDDLIAASLAEGCDRVINLAAGLDTRPYRLEGTEAFLKEYGPAEYHSSADYERVVGSPLPYVITGLPRATDSASALPFPPVPQMVLETDPNAESNFFGPQRGALALYNDTLERFHLDGFVYPAAQIPPPDETMPQDGQLSSGPHSATGWVNRIGVPTVVVTRTIAWAGLAA